MKNIYLLSIDCLRFDYGQIVFDEVNSVLGLGLFFENAYSTGPATPFAFLGILCSKFTSFPDEEISFVLNGKELTMQHQPYKSHKRFTLAQALKRAGYKTYSIPNNPYILPQMDFGSGIDEIVDYNPLLEKQRQKVSSSLREMNPFLYSLAQKCYSLVRSILPLSSKERDIMVAPYSDASKLTELFNEKISNEPGNKFVHIHYMDAHAPFIQNSEVTKSVSKDKLISMNKLLREYIKGERQSISDQHLETFKTVYRHNVLFIAQNIKKLLQNMSEKGLLEDSLVIITADHGELLNEHGMMTHAYPVQNQEHVANLLCEKLTHVPLAIYGLGKGKVSKVVSMVDFPPTLLDLVGSKSPLQWYGSSIFSKEERPAISEVRALGGICYCVRTREWMFVFNERSGKKYLYRRDGQSDELDNVYSSNPKAASEMERLLSIHMKLKNEKWELYLRSDIETLKSRLQKASPPSS